MPDTTGSTGRIRLFRSGELNRSGALFDLPGQGSMARAAGPAGRPGRAGAAVDILAAGEVLTPLAGHRSLPLPGRDRSSPAQPGGAGQTTAAGPAAPVAVTGLPGQDQASGGAAEPGRRCNSIRVLPRVFGFTQSRPRNSATPSS